MKPSVVVLAGPTASGKTELAVELAERLGAEIVNSDSRQAQAELEVGTCVPSAALRARVPHHLYQYAAVGEIPTAADWLARARPIVDRIVARGGRVIVTGGTGLYIRALLDGLDDVGPGADPIRRAELTAVAAQPDGLTRLVAMLDALDPSARAMVRTDNPRRVMRAIEIVEATGRPLGETWHRRSPAPLAPDWLVLGLDVDPRELRRRIRSRTEAMFRSGTLRAEVDRVLAAGTPAETLERAGIGYREMLGVRRRALDEQAAMAATVIRTRQYAKAQRTFLRGEPRLRWIAGAAQAAALTGVDA